MTDYAKIERIWVAVAAIPERKVATYGQVAERADLSGRARSLARGAKSRRGPGSSWECSLPAGGYFGPWFHENNLNTGNILVAVFVFCSYIVFNPYPPKKRPNMNTLNITTFVHKSSAQDANLALKQAVKSMDQARHCAVLWFKEIVSRKLFLELGYSSPYQYAATELGFSSTRCGDFLMLARKLDELPQLRSAMEEGDIGYTKAREVIKVANPQSEGLWIETAKKQSRQELRRQVDRARLEARSLRQENPDQGQLVKRPKPLTPVVATTHRISIEMTSEQMARYEALWEKLHKTGGVPAGSDKAEMLLEGMAALVGNKSEGAPSGPMVQIHVRQCPDCEKSSLSTAQGEVALTPVEIERLSCDARIDRKGQKNKATIAPLTRRRVLARDHHRCQGAGCKHTRFLEVHHRKPRAQGGGNEMENLITLCGVCHRRVHEKGWPSGVADTQTELYRWSGGFQYRRRDLNQAKINDNPTFQRGHSAFTSHEYYTCINQSESVESMDIS